jgi:lipid II:glycine glycyltransferase (peptidoglycan interpeptide bridge formation enzyme)
VIGYRRSRQDTDAAPCEVAERTTTCRVRTTFLTRSSTAAGLALQTLDAKQWDRFVLATPGGDLAQTTAWAQAKRALGFETCQIDLRHDGEIIAVALLVIRRFGRLGAVAYVARGPLVAHDDAEARVRILAAIERAARDHRVHQLIVQPPPGAEAMVKALADRGYATEAPAVAPTATLRIDLTQTLDTILARMSRSKRHQIRRSERKGVKIRLGGRADLDLFYRLHESTARRQKFAPLSRAYLGHQWDALSASDGVQLVFACHDGRTLAGMWVTAFGNTVTDRLSGSNLEGRRAQPNVACQWGAIRWAKAQGYQYYDFGGIDRRSAELMIAGEGRLPEAFYRSSAAFKREFGGEPVVFPCATQRAFNPLVHALIRSSYPRLARYRAVDRLISRLRNG